MEKKDLILWLIAHYEYCKAEIEKLEYVDNILEFCRYENVNCGICYASSNQFEEFIYGKKWVNKYFTKGNKWWCKIPINCITKDEILTTFETRLNILYKELYS